MILDEMELAEKREKAAIEGVKLEEFKGEIIIEKLEALLPYLGD